MSHAVSSALLLQLGLGGSSLQHVLAILGMLLLRGAPKQRPNVLLYVLRPQHELSCLSAPRHRRFAVRSRTELDDTALGGCHPMYMSLEGLNSRAVVVMRLEQHGDPPTWLAAHCRPRHHCASPVCRAFLLAGSCARCLLPALCWLLRGASASACCAGRPCVQADAGTLLGVRCLYGHCFWGRRVVPGMAGWLWRAPSGWR